ncbi:MAG: hypothetical protein EP343_00285 [Deltaproteobacteria bacterium]|nr:MAG: hypothetical protein EP343_00285 [Deltaproteobacteria bacterium]
MSTTFHYRIAGFSEQHTRPYNQDRIYPSPTELPTLREAPLCLAVADGMGGTELGEQAAIAAVNSIPSLHQQLFAAGSPTPELLQETLRRHYQTLNQRIIVQAGEPGRSGSTLSLLVLTEQHFALGHLGDSRVYLWRDQKLHPLTVDDNAFGNFLRQGYIAFHPQQCELTADDRAYLNQHQLLHSELFYIGGSGSATNLSQQLQGRIAALHQQGSIKPVGNTRERLMWALGKAPSFPAEQTAPPVPSGLSNQVQQGDLFLLCSDGLHGVFPHTSLEAHVQDIAQRLNPSQPQDNLLSWGCDMLLQRACDAGSTDNISLLLVQPIPAPSRPQPSTPPKEPQAPQAQASSISSMDALPSLPSMDSAPIEPPLKPEPRKPSPEAPPRSSSSERLPAQNLKEWDDDIRERPAAWKAWLLDARLLYAVIVVLVVALLMRPRPTSPPIKPNPTQQPVQRNVASGNTVWMSVQLSKVANQPMVQRRLKALQKLHRDVNTATTFWQLTGKQEERIRRALKAQALGYQALQHLLQQVPLESHHWTDWDQAMRHGVEALLEAIAPKYQSYLDELSYKLSLPHLRVGWKLSEAMQRSYRNRKVKEWLQQLQMFRQSSWKLLLLQERILAEAPEPSKDQLREGLKLLQRAHKTLQSQNPNHPKLPKLSNRLQLYQAHLAKMK